jgi:hypothetical protein
MIWPTLLIGWLFVHGVSIEHSISLAVVLSVQVLTGIQAWHLLNPESIGTTPETLGTGLAIGTALATASDQILLRTPLTPIAWLFPSLIITILVWCRRRTASIRTTADQEFQWMFIATAAVILGNEKFQDGYGFFLIALAIGFYFSRSRKPRYQIYLYWITSVIGLACLKLFKPVPEYGTWRLRPLYTGTDDLIFSESLSNSLSHFGLNDYGAAVGSPIRYHWFSLAWSGLTSRVSASAPFDVTLHVVPIVAFFGISCLLWAIVFRLTLSKAASNIAVLVLFATDSFPDQIRFFFVSNTSNTLSHIYVLASMLMFLRAIETYQKRWLIIYPISIAITFLAKTPYGAVLLFATLLAVIFLYASTQDCRPYAAVLGLLSLLTTAITYLLFLKPNTWEQRSFRISLNPFHFQDISFRTMVTSVILIASLCIVRFPISLIVYRIPQPLYIRTFYVFLSAGMIAGLARFVFDGGSAEQYFLNSSLIFGAILTGCSVFHLTHEASKKFQNGLLLLFCSISVFSALLFHFVLDNSQVSRSPLGSNLQILLAPAIASLFVAGFILIQTKRLALTHNLINITFILSIIGVSTGIYSLRAIEHDSYKFTETVASTADLKSLDWVRSNVEEEEILATNRFLCNQETPCSFDDSSFLISAVSRRRVLIEGPRFVIGGMPYPAWAKDRIQKSIDFANSPSEESWSQLKLFEVDWFYLDTNFVTSDLDISNEPWSPWATVAYHNSNVYILKLKE